MSKRLSILSVLCGLIIICSCYFGFSGSGKYDYEGEAGKPPETEAGETPAQPNTVIIEITPYEGLPACETLDEEFDLMDDSELWCWFTRLNCYVRMDGDGALHYGKSQT